MVLLLSGFEPSLIVHCRAHWLAHTSARVEAKAEAGGRADIPSVGARGYIAHSQPCLNSRDTLAHHLLTFGWKFGQVEFAQARDFVNEGLKYVHFGGSDAARMAYRLRDDATGDVCAGEVAAIFQIGHM